MSIIVNGYKHGHYVEKKMCRFCQLPVHDIIHLGSSFGLAGGFITNMKNSDEYVYPLTLSLCNNCKYIQCKQLVSSDELFKINYYYYSSMIPSLVVHFQELAQQIYEKFPDKTKRIIEMGCNDGVLLHQLHALNYTNLIGVDPSQTVSKIKNITVYNDYFNHQITDKILTEHGLQDLFISCNSFAHIDDMATILQCMRRILKPTGMALIEVHYAKLIFENKQFDFIYHEHVGYYTVTSLFNILRDNNMSLAHVEQISNHGGSLRCYIEMRPQTEPSETIIKLLQDESILFTNNFFEKYMTELLHWKVDFVTLINNLILDGKKVYGYGASGRANTILNFCELKLECIIDDAESKIGCYTPVLNIPIINSSILYSKTPPDYVIILAWPYASAIMNRHKTVRTNFVIPLPEIIVHSNNDLLIGEQCSN